MPAEGRGPDLRQASKVTRPRRLAHGPATPLERVQKLQTSLQAKAKAEPAFRFYSLWDKVCRADVLDEAYRACRRNGGAPGCDGMTFDRITAHGQERWLEELRQELREDLIALDAERIRSAIEKVAELDPALGGVLSRCASQYAYTAIFDAIEACNQDHSSERPPADE